MYMYMHIHIEHTRLKVLKEILGHKPERIETKPINHRNNCLAILEYTSTSKAIHSPRVI